MTTSVSDPEDALDREWKVVYIQIHREEYNVSLSSSSHKDNTRTAKPLNSPQIDAALVVSRPRVSWTAIKQR